MIKEFSLLLLIFLFLSLVFYFSSASKSLPIENFADKSNEKKFTLKDRTFTYENDNITINPDNTFTAPLQKAVVSKISDLKYNYTINDLKDLKCIIDISYNDHPIKINVNDFNYIIDIKSLKNSMEHLIYTFMAKYVALLQTMF